jgi:triacylglycerol lipase
MGGLDARYAIDTLGLGRKVASLVTIGTPHRGTPVADIGAPLKVLFNGGGLGALSELTTAHLAAFDRAHPKPRGVLCACVLAEVPRDAPVHPLLAVTRRYLNRGGPNDGLVPVASQRFGRVLWRVGADHWAQIGWSSGFYAPDLYEHVLRALRRRGC